MNLCKIGNCIPSNKCSDCPDNSWCDYVWVSDIWKKNSSLLSPLMPGWVKPEFRLGKVCTITHKYDFCIFNVPKKKNTITINDICVSEEARGQGIAKKIIKSLMETYDRDIMIKCVKDSSADSFWNHLGEKIGEEPSKKRDLCIYLIKNENKKAGEIELW